ncbi:MAG: dihydroorotate dehydrogenase electron transfer subunit [Planctomycetaceae bacterium]|nr:dihydroorotate dehydrogenase electron transfer subunit [Planctomycetaceae bacterium]
MTCDFAEKKTVWHGEVTVQSNERVADNTFRLRFVAPDLVARLHPGQFLMLRLANTDDPLLGRPLAVYRVDATTGAVTVVYLVVGKMTERLARLPAGTPLQVWGPLGNGFALPETDHLVMVAGGIGQTPFYMLAEETLGLRKFAGHNGGQVKKATLLFGTRNKNRLTCLDEFRELGVDVHVATEDGSEGTQGFVTDLIAPIIARAALTRVVIACCGPHPMLHAAFRVARSLGQLPCYVSLESPMACGLGICYSCVVKYRDEQGEPDYVRTCVEGPVFDAYRLVWDA